ncbi:ARM repeat-containing protein [Lichtheimia hyalospora FSU 10163]|nr:ARM repeat-containing protein [Lichtheimia hyalospora FSU 10163]
MNRWLHVGKDENVSVVISHGAIGPLLDVLSLRRDLATMDAIREKRKLLEAVTRALKSIFTCPNTPKDDIFMEKHIADLVTLLDATSSYLCQQGRPSATSESLSFGMIAEFTAAVVAKCCDTQEQQVQLASAGVIPPLVNLLHSGHIKAQEAALDALATLCRENNELGEIIIHAKPFGSNQLTPATMLDFVKDRCPNMRLIAATCLTNLYRTGVFTEPFNEIVLVVLPALVKLLKDPSGDIQERAPLVLADLVKDSEDMQKAAYDADAISKLAELLSSTSTKENEEDAKERIGVPGVGSVAKRKEKIRENSLIAIAAASLLKEECRTQAIDSKVLPHVVSALQSKYPHVRLAACQCAKSLSRSVSNLRTSLVDAGVATPLLKLLYDESTVIQAAACGALCNLTLDFSPMKKNVIDAGAIDRFVEYAKSDDPKLQLNGVWALNSLLYKADLQAKKAVMKSLTYDTLIELLHEPDMGIQEQALEIVRNLVCGQQEDVEHVIDGIGKDDLLDVLESKLQVTSNMGLEGEDSNTMASILEPALYIITNMSSSYEEPRKLLMSRPNIVNSVASHLSHSAPNIRVAAVWCIINWTWITCDDDEDALAERVNRLRALGVEQQLRVMEKDSSRDVRDRVRTALDQMTALES